MPEIERDGEELPRLSPGVGCDSTAQGNKVTGEVTNPYLFTENLEPNIIDTIHRRFLGNTC